MSAPDTQRSTDPGETGPGEAGLADTGLEDTELGRTGLAGAGPAANAPSTRAGSSAPSPGGTRADRTRWMRPLMWRLHFLGGVLAGPVVLSLCVSGILFAWHPQIDDVRFGDVMHRSAAEAAVPLSEQVAAAQAAHPDSAVFAVEPATAQDNTKVVMDPPGGGAGFGGPDDAVWAYVDPATGAHTGDVAEADSSNRLLRSWHSSWTLGADAEPVTELAGSWFLASLLTGLFLWWPGLRRRGSKVFAMRRHTRGRVRSKEVHNLIGVTLLVPMLLLAVTGLTWTSFAGDRVDTAKGWLEVGSLRADTAVDVTTDGRVDLSAIDVAAARAVEAELVEPVQITVPPDPATGWVVASNDLVYPVERNQLVVDGTTGEVTDVVDYADEHWFNKLRTAGILFHQAQLFGVTLQVLMSLLAVAIVVLVAYGYRMWWQRRPKGRMGTPAPLRSWVRDAPLSMVVATIALGWLMPVLGLSLLVWLVVEAAWRWTTGDQPVPRPTTAVEVAVMTALGLAMLVVPGLGEDAELASTVLRAGAWFWSRPLGLVLLLGAAAGARAMATRPTTPADDEQSADEVLVLD